MSHTLVAVSRAIAPRAQFDSDIEEAREALEFWSQRAERLPWHRRKARREAEVMAARWRARLVAAHLDPPGLRRISPAGQSGIGGRPGARPVPLVAGWRTPPRRGGPPVAGGGPRPLPPLPATDLP